MEIKSNNSRISKYFNLPSLNQTEQQLLLKDEDNLYTNTIPLVNNLYIFGIEVEVEQVENPQITFNHTPYWNITGDNSLRNNGVEFVSLPLKANQLEGALLQLQKSLPNTADFSPRTSTHVHMNVRDLSIDQITSLLLLYTTVEDLLFHWVGHNRDKSVFCIKLTETDYVQLFLSLQNDPRDTIASWNKYTAFNLLPLQSKGTLDIPRILCWINLLSCLKTAAKKKPLTQILQEINELNTSSLYEEFVRDLFGDYYSILTKDIYNLQAILEESVSYVKLAAIQKEITPRNTPTIGDDFTTPDRTTRIHIQDGWVYPTNTPIEITRPGFNPDIQNRMRRILEDAEQNLTITRNA